MLGFSKEAADLQKKRWFSARREVFTGANLASLLLVREDTQLGAVGERDWVLPPVRGTNGNLS